MTRIAVALLAALAAVAYVLARPRRDVGMLDTFRHASTDVRNSPSVSRDSTAGWGEAGWE